MTSTELTAARLRKEVTNFLKEKGYKQNEDFNIIDKPDGTIELFYFVKRHPEISSLFNGLDSKFDVVNNYYHKKCAVIWIRA